MQVLCWELLTEQPWCGQDDKAAREAVMHAAEGGGPLPSERDLAPDVSSRLGTGCVFTHRRGQPALMHK